MVVAQSPSTSTSDHNCVNLRVSTCHTTTNPIKISPRNIRMYTLMPTLEEVARYWMTLTGMIMNSWLAMLISMGDRIHECYAPVHSYSKFINHKGLTIQHCKTQKSGSLAILCDYKKKCNRVSKR